MKRFAANLQLPASSAQLVLVAVLLGIALARLPLLWAAGLVVGTAVFLLIIIQPLIGLGLALLLGPFGALENAIGWGSPLDSGQLLLLLTIAIWLANGLRDRQIRIPRTPLDLPLLFFLLVTAVSLLNAPSITVGLKELIKWIEILFIMWLVVDMSRRATGGDKNRTFAPLRPVSDRAWVARSGDRRQQAKVLKKKNQRFVLRILLISGLLQAIVGLWQFGLRSTGPEHFLVLDRFYRAYGTFEQPNPFGGFMNLTALLALGVLIGWLVYFWRQKSVGWLKKGEEKGSDFSRQSILPVVSIFVVAALAGGSLIASWSRGAWLGFAVGTAVLGYYWPRKRWLGMMLLGLGMGTILIGLQLNLIPSSISERLTGFSQDLRFGDVRGLDINDSNYAVLERLAHWQAALNMAQENVWLGVGFGNYEPAYSDYALINWPAPLGHAHNYYLNLLAEVGVLGLAAYILLWTAVFRQTIRVLKQFKWPHRGIALGLLAAWAALAAHHLVDKLYVNNIYIHLGVMLGLLQLLDQDSGELKTQ